MFWKRLFGVFGGGWCDGSCWDLFTPKHQSTGQHILSIWRCYKGYSETPEDYSFVCCTSALLLQLRVVAPLAWRSFFLPLTTGVDMCPWALVKSRTRCFPIKKKKIKSNVLWTKRDLVSEGSWRHGPSGPDHVWITVVWRAGDWQQVPGQTK